jgi:peptidyl-prolyl cis-trans isomerase C
MRRAVFAAVLSATVLVAWPETRAAVPDQDPVRRLRPVCTLGDRRAITTGEIEDRIQAMPPFQRATFGSTVVDIRKRFLLEVLVPEGLFALGGKEEKLDLVLPSAFDVERAISKGTLKKLRDLIGPAANIPMPEVQQYYDEHRDRYDTPERIQIWRILCKTQEEAQTVLDTAKKDGTPKTFGDLARDHSIDKGSNLRSGNVGFINPDGSSNEPGLKLDVAVVHAAQTVRDGQFVPAPVKEGDGYAVVWRRGTIAANKRDVADVAAQIRDTMWKARVKTATDALLAHLRTARLRDYNDAPLVGLTLPGAGDAGGLVVRHDAAAP